MISLSTCRTPVVQKFLGSEGQLGFWFADDILIPVTLLAHGSIEDVLEFFIQDFALSGEGQKVSEDS